MHVLPLEYYPPAKNILKLFSEEHGWEVRVWTSQNRRGHPEWSHPGVSIHRPYYPEGGRKPPARIWGYLKWHWTTARCVARWEPDVLMYVEPHSALAAWFYFKVFRGRARLCIHHHEYYAPGDYQRPGMKTLKPARRLEGSFLFPRAEWVSQTNEKRLALLREWNQGIRNSAAAVFPNYPPASWLRDRGPASEKQAHSGPLRLIYLGSASFADTYIREVAEWVVQQPKTVSLHVCGDNVHAEVWKWLESLRAENITLEPGGWDYDQLPKLLTRFDVGLILYKGNTLNFVHNVPNKAVEYLACGLQVWYPGVMEAMKHFHRVNPELPLREIDFNCLHTVLPVAAGTSVGDMSHLTLEFAAEPLLQRLRRLPPESGSPTR